MSLIEHLRKGKELIARYRSFGKDTNALEAEIINLQCRIEEEVKRLKLSDFRKRNIAVEIYSEVLGSNLWFCSDMEIVTQIKGDDPEAACYTVDGLRCLLSLDSSPADLQKIHEAKIVFPGSKIKKPFSNDIYETPNEKEIIDKILVDRKSDL